jgi:signal transduction histidine kinase
MPKTKNLDILKTTISKILSVFILVNVSLVSIGLGIFILIYFSEAKHTSQQLMIDSNNILQGKLASELEIVANNSNFVEYMRFGEVSRNEYYTTIKWLFRNLDDNLVKSVLIRNNQGVKIFEYGKPTSLYATLKLCYLNNKINFKLGNCENSITIYFDQKHYIAQLKNINNNILACTDYLCSGINPFQNKFSGFNIINKSAMSIPITYQIRNPMSLFLIFGMFSILLGVSLVLIHKIIRKLIDRSLVEPLLNITQQLKSNKPISNNVDYLVELVYLVGIINDYKTHEIDIELGKKSIQIAHDIGSPISSIEFAVGNLKKYDTHNDNVELLDEAIKMLRGISSNLLSKYRGGNILDSSIDDESIPRFFILSTSIQNLIKTKEFEWKTKKYTIKYIFDEESSMKWCYAALSDIKTKLSNLLNNAYESLDKNNGLIEVGLTIANKDFLLIIHDNGVGIPDNKIAEVLNGKSLKHIGKGIGLSSANEYFRTLNGQLELKSCINKGTKITIRIPIAKTPAWSPMAIKCNVNSTLIIVDDDLSMHMLWQQKAGTKNLKLKLFINVIDFLEWTKLQANMKQFIYIIDYNLNDKIYNGFKVISDLCIQEQSYLVTSHAEELWLQNICISNKLFLIPKQQISSYQIDVT